MSNNEGYATRWADNINETYDDETRDALIDGLEMDDAAVFTALDKAARALREGETVTLNGAELDVIRHFMPAHEVEQSGARRWLLESLVRFVDGDRIEEFEEKCRQQTRSAWSAAE